ncbi:MAG: imelysin family protein [Chitinophagales bacterium]
MHKYNCLALIAFFILISSCKPGNGGDKFDRSGMLTNVGNSVIIPAHEQFEVAINLFKQQKDSFVANPTTASLDSLLGSFLSAYVAFMKVETYSFSPSGELRNLNVFATDTTQINANIVSGVYDLNAANNITAKGFPAIDYLLFSRNSTETVSLFTTDANASKRIQYLDNLTSEVETVAVSSANAWSNYLPQFITASGTDVGSSVGMLVNDISFQVERCRRDRVGNSLGYIGFVSSGNTDPHLLEGCYVNYSKELLLANLRELKNLYEGGAGSGFDDYLVYLNADYNGQPLAPAISAQFDLVILKAQNVPVDFLTALNTHKPEMESLFLELKKLTVMLKVDMSSQLGVIINYSDNDGD